MNRHFYKCPNCLATVALDTNVQRPICGVCESGMYWMGKVVEENKWERKESKCKCDARCVEATGPKCDCQCCGENHGAGRLGYYSVVAETGQVIITPAKDAEKHKAMADEYLAAYNAAVERIEAKFGKEIVTAYLTRSRWLDYSVWQPIKRAFFELERADVKIHKTRMTRLPKVCAV